MFKRLFLLSGIIAFVLACATMWFWYLPMKEVEQEANPVPIEELELDSADVRIESIEEE